MTFPIETYVKLVSVDGATTVYSTGTRQQMPQLDPYNDERKCCGMCTVYFSTVDVLYWPLAGANTACLENDNSAGKPASLATIRPTNNSVTTTVGPDGFTFASPSIYVAYNDISASDLCGRVGPIHTSVTLSFAPGDLSTIEYDTAIWMNPLAGGGPGVTKPFELSNFPCPPQSLIDQQASANGIGFELPARGTYAAIIAPPPFIQTLEPAWKWCQSFYAFDPPRALTPASALISIPTPTGNAGKVSPVAMPSATFDPPPMQTQPPSSPAVSNPARLPPDGSSQGSNFGPAVPSDPKDPNEFSIPDDPTDPNIPSDPKDPLNNPTSPLIGDLGNSPNPPALPIAPGPNGQLFPEQNKPKIPVYLSQYPETQPAASSPLVKIGDQIFTALPEGGLSIAGTTIKAGDPAITIHGIPIFISGSDIIAGQSTLPLPKVSPNQVFIAAGQTFTRIGNSAVAIDGQVLSTPGDRITIARTPITLLEAGLAIGSQIFALPTPTPDSIPNTKEVLTIAGKRLTLLGGGSMIIDGATLSINGPASKVSGTAISLAASGLVVDSQTYSLPTLAPNILSDAVVINGATLSFGGPARTVSGTVFTLATGSAGFVVSRLGAKSAGLVASATAGESFSLNSAGTLVPLTGGESELGVGGMGFAIMRGFGPFWAVSVSVPAATGMGGTETGSGTGKNFSGVLGFTGEGERNYGVSVFNVILLLCLNMAVRIVS